MGKVKLKSLAKSLSKLRADCMKLTILDSCELPLKDRTQLKCRICVAKRS